MMSLYNERFAFANSLAQDSCSRTTRYKAKKRRKLSEDKSQLKLPSALLDLVEVTVDHNCGDEFLESEAGEDSGEDYLEVTSESDDYLRDRIMLRVLVHIPLRWRCQI